MRPIQLIALVAGVTLGIGGCGLFGGGQDTVVTPTPEPDPSVVVEPIEPEPTAEAPETQPLTVPAPDTAQVPPPPGLLPPDLISSTNPNQRAQGVQRDRPDPFAGLPANPTIQTPPVAQVPQTVPQLPGLPGVPRPGVAPGGTRPGTAASPGTPGTRPGPTGATGATGPTGAAGSPGTTGGQLAPVPNLVPQLPPPPPQPDLARAVQVTGVIQIGNTVHAIVSAPNEPSSRYVRVGQRLSNGQVLVKRIEMNAGLEPVVILEQNGIEVSRAVGEGGQEEPAAAAIAPPQFSAG